MSDQTDHVLDLIDGALSDYEMSGDAMRWTPGPDIQTSSVDIDMTSLAAAADRLGFTLTPWQLTVLRSMYDLPIIRPAGLIISNPS